MIINISDMLVDDDIRNYLGTRKIHTKSGYARISLTKDEKRAFNTQETCMNIHDLVRCPLAGKFTDHINRNKLDNRRSNLRLATRHQNMRNVGKKIRKGSFSIPLPKGVYTHRLSSGLVFRARISNGGGSSAHLGLHKTISGAAKAYNAAASRAYGEFAYLNPVEE